MQKVGLQLLEKCPITVLLSNICFQYCYPFHSLNYISLWPKAGKRKRMWHAEGDAAATTKAADWPPFESSKLCLILCKC